MNQPCLIKASGGMDISFMRGQKGFSGDLSWMMAAANAG